MSLSALAKRVLHHPALQRLKHVPQLGFTSQIWKNITGTRYNRLTHSVGVSRLAKFALRTVMLNSNLGVPTARQELWVELAGLMHDVGHGPFSHAFDHALQAFATVHPHWLINHEARGQRLVKFALESFPDFTSEDVAAVSFMIDPKNQHYLLPRSLPAFMTTLVSNARHGIDVDRLDYLQRDSALGIVNTEGLAALDVHRLISNSRFVDSDWVFSLQDVLLVQKVMKLRTALHGGMYQHPEVVAHDLSFQTAMIHYIHSHPHQFDCLKMETDEDCVNFVELMGHIQKQFEVMDMRRFALIQTSHQVFSPFETQKGDRVYAYKPSRDPFHEKNMLLTIPFWFKLEAQGYGPPVPFFEKLSHTPDVYYLFRPC